MTRIQLLEEVNTSLPGDKWQFPSDPEATTYIDPSKVQMMKVFTGLVQDANGEHAMNVKLMTIIFDNGCWATTTFSDELLGELTGKKG